MNISQTTSTEKHSQRYPIGTMFRPIGRHSKVCTVTDFLRTYNSRGDMVRVRYVAQHQFLGQTITDHDVAEATIARGFIS